MDASSAQSAVVAYFILNSFCTTGAMEECKSQDMGERRKSNENVRHMQLMRIVVSSRNGLLVLSRCRSKVTRTEVTPGAKLKCAERQAR